MKRLKILGFLLIFTVVGCLTANSQNAKSGNWKIRTMKSGGFAGINKRWELDHEGNLTRTDKTQRNYEKIDETKVAEIAKLVKELKLPGTRQGTVKGDRIYDGIYTELVISLNGKDYRVEGNAFYEAKVLTLSSRQKATLEKLKTKLAVLQGFLPDSMNN